MMPIERWFGKTSIKKINGIMSIHLISTVFQIDVTSWKEVSLKNNPLINETLLIF